MNRHPVINVEPFAAGDFEAARVEAELMKDRGMNVCDVVTIFDRVKADFVSRAVDNAAFDSAAGHPDGETEDVMVTAIGSLSSRGTTELTGKDYDR